MKDTKALLKEAREAIKNKNFLVALQLSKLVLKEDENNYMALLFSGLSFLEVGPTDQALKAFRKAMVLNASNPLAWTGIINYHEKVKSDEASSELIKAYIEILNLENSKNKIAEYTDRLVELLQNKKDWPEGINDKLEKCLVDLLANDSFKKRDLYLVYLSLLYKQKKFEDLVEHAEKLHKFFQSDTVSLSWICKIYNQLYVEQSNLADKFTEKAGEFSKKLLEMETKNAMALFTRGIFHLKECKVIEAKDTLVEVTKLRPGLLHARVLLTLIFVDLKLFNEALQSYSSSEKLSKSIGYSNQALNKILHDLKIELYSISHKESDWEKVLDLYKQENDEQIKETYLKHVILAYINLGNFVEARLNISKLKTSNQISKLLLAKCLHKEGNLEEALSVLGQGAEDYSDWLIELGLIYWTKEDYKKCLIQFLKAVKMDPNNYLTFVYLGNCYQKLNDFDKARRCYEKAFKINSNSKEIVTELSKIYCHQKNWVSSQNLLQSLTTGPINNQNSWAWIQLGLSYLEQEDYSKAIDNLRLVLRVENNNGRCWESLGDAYFATGSYTSALKCYQKSLELIDNGLYPSIQIANIKKLLGLYDEARSDFEKIILDNGHYVPALKGLAEICICQARKCYKERRLGTARDHIQIAINNLTIAVEQRCEFSCLWKLLGDSCLYTVKLPEKYAYLFISDSLIDGKNISHKTLIKKEEIYSCSSRFYCKAISLTEDNELLWHDLGTSYLAHALHSDTEKKKTLLLYAMAVAQHCTSISPCVWQYWNLMGNIAMHQEPPNYALAQHALIKAVKEDPNCAVSWVNLGVLYLLNNDLILANKAFAQGQRSDPEYVNSWIGQALVAEIMGHEETMDLFRHSTQIGLHQQGVIGYAHWVCKTLQDSKPGVKLYAIHNMHAIQVACDVMTWYIENNLSDGCAWNILGILRERMGLKTSTLEAFKNAYSLCRKEERDKARVNYGRILAKLEKYHKAINMFQEVEEATFNSGSGLALSLYKDKQYEESYNTYEQALHWLAEEQSNQSELLVALASMAYKFQDADSAKTLLFQSIQLKPPSPWGFYATLSFGLLHDDIRLSTLVLKELEAHKNDQDCLPHYAALLLYFHLVQGNRDKAVLEAISLIRKYPGNGSIWLNLSRLFLRIHMEKQPSSFAAKSARVAMRIDKTDTDVSRVLGLAALSSLLAGELNSAMLSAQKAIYSYPNIVDGWAVLFSTLLKEKNSCPETTTKILHQYLLGMEAPNNIKEWAMKMYST